MLSLKQDQSCLARQAEVSGSWWHFARNVMAIYVPWSNTKVGHEIELCKFNTTKEETNLRLSFLLRKCGHTYISISPWPFPIYFTCQLIVIHSLHTVMYICTLKASNNKKNLLLQEKRSRPNVKPRKQLFHS